VGPFNAHVYRESLTKLIHSYKDSLDWEFVKEPKDDGISGFHSGLVCGFVDCEQFFIWCNGRFAVNDLLEAGFKINQYLIPEEELLVGRTQVAFRLAGRTPVATYNWEDLLDKLSNQLYLI
jgi:hypothetical protein